MKQICVDCGSTFFGHGNTIRCDVCWKRNNNRKVKAYSRQSRIKKQIIKKRGNLCEMCGASGNNQTIYLHHIVPIKKGGKTQDANLKLLCHECHLFRAHKGRY